MKKLFVILFAAALLLCSCANPGGSSSAPEDLSAAQTEEQTSAEESAVYTKSVFEPVKGKIAEPELRRLFDGNLDCVFNIFDNLLPHESEPVYDTFCYVNNRFSTYAELEEYVNGIYCAETAKKLLEYNHNGRRRYFDYNGRLCVDLATAGGRGYYVDWSDYKITVEILNETECYFTVSATVTYPADEPKAEPYGALVHAVCEDGVWKLEKSYD